jgi:hypothetical protein
MTGQTYKKRCEKRVIKNIKNADPNYAMFISKSKWKQVKNLTRKNKKDSTKFHTKLCVKGKWLNVFPRK